MDMKENNKLKISCIFCLKNYLKVKLTSGLTCYFFNVSQCAVAQIKLFIHSLPNIKVQVYNRNKLKKDKFIKETATELVQLNKFRFFILKEVININKGVYKYE